VVSVLGPARSADGPAWSPSQLPPEHCSGTALRFLHPRMSAPNAPPHASTSGTIIGEGPCTPQPLHRHCERVQKCTHARKLILWWQLTSHVPACPAGHAVSAPQPRLDEHLAVVARGRGCPSKGEIKCERCRKKVRPCGPECPSWPGEHASTPSGTGGPRCMDVESPMLLAPSGALLTPHGEASMDVDSGGALPTRRTSVRSRTCAACLVDHTLSAARALDARSTPLPSAVLATLWPALEGIFVSPCSPTDIPSCAGRVSGVSATVFAHQVLESAPESARASPRRARLARVRAHGVPRRGRRFMGRERVGGGVRRRSWRLSMSTARGAYAGVRRVAAGRRGARRGLAARARTYARGWCRITAYSRFSGDFTADVRMLVHTSQCTSLVLHTNSAPTSKTACQKRFMVPRSSLVPKFGRQYPAM
jgi:hypothetical protein